MSRPSFDLQAHSLHSDGALAPADVIRHAAEAGVRLAALSDHDTVDGVDEALAAGARHGLEVVPAVEITVLDDVREDLHVLGYRVDHRDVGLLNLLNAARADRAARAGRMADALRAAGWTLDDTKLRAEAAAGRSVGRPHLAQAVLSESVNAPRLAAEGITDAGALIAAYLISGAPAFVGRTTPTVSEAVSAIHGACGVAVWAHPFWDLTDPEVVEATLRRFVTDGLDGVEAFYTTHTRDQTDLLVALSAELGLLTTGSADFHDPAHRLFNRFAMFSLHGHEAVLGPIAAAPERGR